MAKEHVIDYRDESGQSCKLDIANGYLYDNAGNQIGKWSPVDNGYGRMMADYCAEQNAQAMAFAAGNGDPERTRTVLASARSVLMDLGTGDVHQAAALPNYAAGYSNEAPMADLVSAPLLVAKPSDKYYTFAKEDAFQSAVPLAGAPAGQVPEIAPRLSNATFTTVERALGGFVATEIEAAADAPLKIRQATARRIMTALMIGREQRVAALLTNTASWDSSCYTTLAAAAKWNGGASADPVADLQARIEASWGGVSGILMPRPVFNAFVRSPSVRSYFAYKNNVTAIPKPEEVQAILQLPPIYVASMQAMTSSTAKGYIWGNDVVLFRTPQDTPPVSQDDVASAYPFRWNGGATVDGSVASGGWMIREYFVQDRGARGGNKMVVIHQDAETMTSAYVGGLIKAAYQ